MARAIKNISGAGKRDDLVIVVQSYSRSAFLMERFFAKALGSLDLDSIDILLLGWHNKPPARRLIDKAIEMKEKGLCRFLALSGHKRPLFPVLAEQGLFDVFHVRYNAAHRGAESEVFPYLKFEGRQGIVTYTATRWGNLLNPRKMPPGESVPSASDCYRFALSNPSVDVCLCGPKDLNQMREALRTLDRGPLNRQEMDWMGRVGEHVRLHSRKFF
jgi:predicted aldo/keto reductase-like oxidoreductase